MEHRCDLCGDWYFSAYDLDGTNDGLCNQCKESNLDDYDPDDNPNDREPSEPA